MPQGPNLNPGQTAWGFLNQAYPSCWNFINQSYQDTILKKATSASLNPLALAAQIAWKGQVAGLPAGVAVAWDFGAWVGAVVDFGIALLNTVLGPTLTKALLITSPLSFVVDWVGVDTTSAAYQAGTYAGQVVNIALTLATPAGGLLGGVVRGLNYAQAVGGLADGVAAAANGDFGGAALSIAGGLLALSRTRTGCQITASIEKSFTKTLGSGLTSALSQSVNLGSRALGLVSASSNISTAVTQLGNGDILGGLLNIVQAGATTYRALQANACFSGDMLLDAEDGKKRADQIQLGDRLWSRHEFDPHGPIELKTVEEVFTRVSPILNVHVAGQVIRTTREHPFYVESRGWIPAGILQIGDLLTTRNGLLVPVEGIADSGAVETVYNWRIGEYHTYFVSATDAGAGGLAHNACTVNESGLRTGSYNDLRRAGVTDGHHIIQNAAVRNVPRYSRGQAPAIELPGPSTQQGTPHYEATQEQTRPGGGTYGAERRIGYRALRVGGVSRNDSRQAIRAADNYFMGQLGLNMNSPLPIPGNR